jgi:hypothetical protein
MRLTLEQRTAALLALVEEYRARRCAELLEPAREQARALLRSARAEGRRRVHTTVGELRHRLATEIGAAQARLATERRLAAQKRAVQVLQQAWTALREALRARWRDPSSRSRWLEMHLARALDVLPREPWQVEFAADWPQAERDALAARLGAAGVTAVAWQARDDIDGGVRIRAGSNVVDATIDGLLADRAAIEGRLLDLLQAMPVDAHADDSSSPPAHRPATEPG